MDRDLRGLLDIYIGGRITLAEFRLLQEALPEVSDDDLARILTDVWNDYRVPGPDVEPGTEPAPTRRISPLRRVVRIAAAVAIPLLVGAAVWFYADNMHLNSFITRDVSINVKSGEKADIVLPDGSKVYLNSASSITYPADFGLTSRKVDIVGEAFFEVAKDPEKPFTVSTEFLQVEVLGTKFNINSYADFDFVETTLVEGSIKLNTRNGNVPVTTIMHPGEKTVYDKLTGKITRHDTNARLETAWLRGEMVFRSAEFPDIVKHLEHRYGVTIRLEGYDTDNAHLFTGSFREEYIHGIMKILKLHYDFDYFESEGEIIIKFK